MPAAGHYDSPAPAARPRQEGAPPASHSDDDDDDGDDDDESEGEPSERDEWDVRDERDAAALGALARCVPRGAGPVGARQALACIAEGAVAGAVAGGAGQLVLLTVGGMTCPACVAVVSLMLFVMLLSCFVLRTASRKALSLTLLVLKSETASILAL